MLRRYLVVVTLFLFIPILVGSVSIGEEKELFVESSYDHEGRDLVGAELRVVTEKINFYMDKGWWEELEEEEREEHEKTLHDLGKEFEKEVYPQISEDFGDHPKNGVVGNEDRIAVLFHPMERDAGGYFRTGDQYSVYQYSRSNEKNILYLNTDFMESPDLPGYLAHEYVHLVTFNEKNREHRVTEEIWLNELRAEIVMTLLNYNEEYEGSNLEMRVKSFLHEPDVSLTEWTEQGADYGAVNMFGHYLLDHYGEDILYDSLRSPFVGIPSIDHALEENEHEKDFEKAFTDWTVAVYLNDCSAGERYCYQDNDLGDINISPSTVFIPSGKDQTFGVEHETENFAGNWHRLKGEKGDLHLSFDSKGKDFEVPYVLCEEDNECEVRYMDLDKESDKGEVIIEDFGSEYDSLTLIPSLQEKREGYNGAEESFSFKWEAQMKEAPTEEEIKEMLFEIKERVERLRERVARMERRFERDLHYGMKDSEEVERLQEVLKEEEVYPEGIVTGNFYNLTRKAVIRFQEKYAGDILDPLGLEEGTGYVGELTREKLNELVL